MTQPIGAYSPETARIILETVRYLRESGFVVPVPGRGAPSVAPPTPIYVRNDSGEEIPAWGCMQVTGTVDANNQSFSKVTKPTTSGVQYLFNGQQPIETGGYGVAQEGNKARAYKSSGTVTFGQLWRPTSGQWYLTQGSGRFPAIGLDDIDDNVFWVRTDFNDIVHFKSPVGGIPAITTLTMGSATCDRYSCTTTGVLADSGEDITIYNAHAAFAASTLGTAALNDAGLWVAITENCS